MLKEITVQQLDEMRKSGKAFKLIDVREPHEYDFCNIGGELIPLPQVPVNAEKFESDVDVVVHCRSGKRSGDAILYLQQNNGFENLYNLRGGILAWADEIDPSVPKY